MTMSGTSTPPLSLGRRVKRFMSDYPVVPLVILLVLLIGALQILRPGIVNPRWAASTIQFAIPLALLAGCQTMTMLTGGIDMSVGTVATVSAFVLTTQVVQTDPALAFALGLAIYGIGSSELAAFRSGVPVARTKIIAYAIAGLFSAMGGIALTMSTGIGAPIPGPYLLASVAATVLGGVVLGGGRGGLVGPIVAVFVLRLVRTDLTLLSVDPNVTTIVEGTIMVVVVMLGAFLAMRSRSP